jgi:hypothetical protein
VDSSTVAQGINTTVEEKNITETTTSTSTAVNSSTEKTTSTTSATTTGTDTTMEMTSMAQNVETTTAREFPRTIK